MPEPEHTVHKTETTVSMRQAMATPWALADEATTMRITQQMADAAARMIDGVIQRSYLGPAARAWAQREHWHEAPVITHTGFVWYRCTFVRPGNDAAECPVILMGGTARERPPGHQPR